VSLLRQLKGRAGLASVVTRARAGRSGSRGLILDRSRDVAAFHSTQIGYGRVQPSSHAMSIGVPVASWKTSMALARKYLEEWLSNICCSARGSLGILITTVKRTRIRTEKIFALLGCCAA
jgi:hypothetical protein